MNLFKVGCNFDFELLNIIERLNKKYEGKGKVVELFGSDKSHEELTARPGWRLPDIDKEFFERYIKKCNELGLVFNYTMNSIQPYGSKNELVNNKGEIQVFVKYLESIGVKRITIANPMLAMIIREVSNIDLELSTIAHIDTVTQFKYYHETLGINKFCNSILKNRNKEFLTRAAKYCNDNNILFELLANEFCGIAGVDNNGNHYASHCAFRDSCYLCHAANKTKEDSMSYNNYPMKFCMCARETTPESWLRMRWIRPEDLHYYNEIGINYFKISGRTGSTEYLEKMIEGYLSENWNDNLLSLWKPLQTIYDKEEELTYNHPIYIDNKKLNGFLDRWFEGNGWECENHMCGVDCKYCEEFTKNYLTK